MCEAHGAPTVPVGARGRAAPTQVTSAPSVALPASTIPPALARAEHARAGGRSTTAGTSAGNRSQAFGGRTKDAAEHFGTKPMSHVTTADVAAFFTSLRRERGLAPSSPRNHKPTLSAAFTLAIECGAAVTNPVPCVKLPKVDVKPIPHLTAEEVQAAYDAVPDDVLPAVVLMGEAGLRRHEALDLTWGEVDADLSRITVARSKSHRARTVPLTAEAGAAVEALLGASDVRPAPDTPLFDIAASSLNARFRTGRSAPFRPSRRGT